MMTGCVSPFEEQLIQVDFTSISLKAYEYFLLVDVEDVGEGIGSLPIFAECQVCDKWYYSLTSKRYLD